MQNQALRPRQLRRRLLWLTSRHPGISVFLVPSKKICTCTDDGGAGTTCPPPSEAPLDLRLLGGDGEGRGDR
eukprot:1215577-Pyramimonas_sp.AAC.1